MTSHAPVCSEKRSRIKKLASSDDSDSDEDGNKKVSSLLVRAQHDCASTTKSLCSRLMSVKKSQENSSHHGRQEDL